MSLRELVGKTTAFVVSTALFIFCGLLVLGSTHASTDTMNLVLGLTLLALGVMTAGFGVLSIGGIIYEDRARRREAALHVVPRSIAPSTPPAWGMGNVGRVTVGEEARPTGKGGTRVMSVHVNNLDAPLMVGFLLVWTIVALILASPK